MARRKKSKAKKRKKVIKLQPVIIVSEPQKSSSYWQVLFGALIAPIFNWIKETIQGY